MTQTSSPAARQVVVIGGGISGLAAAHRLTELDPAIRLTLFEASDRFGGVLETVRRDGFLVEGGADNFITTMPWALDLCRRIGFSEQLIQTNSNYRHAFVVRGGKLHPIPDGFVVMAPNKIRPMLSTPILSPLGKLRLAWECFVPRRQDRGDESVASFCRRRLGRETYERLVQPLIGGIYTGDPQRLSLRATMPRFAEMEEQYGSLIRALRSARKPTESASGASYSMFVAPRDGMMSLVNAIVERLPPETVRLNTRVTELVPTNRGWHVKTATRGETLECDAVVLATPAPIAARLTKALDRKLTNELEEMHHARCSIVSLGYRRSRVAHPLDGFGVVVPHVEGRRILSASFSSVKYAGRSPDGSVLIRVFIGGDCQPELAELPDDRLLDVATAELRDLIGVQGDPSFIHINHRGAAMPQYHVGHADKMSRIRNRLSHHPGLFLAGNAYDGVGVPNCIRSGEQAAESIVMAFANSSLKTCSTRTSPNRIC